MRRLLTVSHSYVVAANRRLASELARAGTGSWEVVAVAPRRFAGDLRWIDLEAQEGERCRTIATSAHLARSPHLFFYGLGLRRALRDGRWDVVHGWEEPFVAAGGQLAAWTPRDARLVFATFQNLSKSYPPPFGAVERFAMKRAAGWLAFGRTGHDTLAQRTSYRDRPSAVIPPGVDVERFRPDESARKTVRARLGWNDAGPPVVGFLGRFVPEKGVERLTRALELVRGEWRALFVGGGPLEAQLREWASRHGSRARVVTGVPHDDVPAWLNAMDVLCAPSQTTARWREQFGRMLIEAFACGVAVLGSDSGEIPHVLGEAGAVAPEGSDEAWARELGALLDTPARREELGRRGLERARATFAWPVVAREHLRFFEALCDRGPA